MVVHNGGPNIILFSIWIIVHVHANIAVHGSSIARNCGFSSTDAGAFCYIWLVNLAF